MIEIFFNFIIDGYSLYVDKDYVYVCVIMVNNGVIREFVV